MLARCRCVSRRLQVITPFADAPKLPPGFEDATWARLRTAVRAVCAREAVADSLEVQSNRE